MGRKVSLSIDLDALPEDQADELEELLKEADFFELPSDLTRTEMPDSMTYNITVISDEHQHSVRCSDTTVPEDLHPLLDELIRQARMQG